MLNSAITRYLVTWNLPNHHPATNLDGFMQTSTEQTWRQLRMQMETDRQADRHTCSALQWRPSWHSRWYIHIYDGSSIEDCIATAMSVESLHGRRWYDFPADEFHTARKTTPLQSAYTHYYFEGKQHWRWFIGLGLHLLIVFVGV